LQLWFLAKCKIADGPVPKSREKTAVLSSLEFLFLLALWMAFVSAVKIDEVLVGIPAAGLSAFADGVVKAKRFAKFRPEPQWLLFFFWQPWYALSGTWAIFVALGRHLLGKKSESQLRVVRFRAGGEDPESCARRALAIILTTIPPNFLVIGIDKEKDLMLIHQVSPTGTPDVTRRLGAES